MHTQSIGDYSSKAYKQVLVRSPALPYQIGQHSSFIDCAIKEKNIQSKDQQVQLHVAQQQVCNVHALLVCAH